MVDIVRPYRPFGAMIPNSASRTYVPSFFPQPEPYSAPREAAPNSTVIPSLFPTAQAGTRDPSDWDYARAGLRTAGLFFPPAKAASTLWDGASGIVGGFNRSAFGERPEERKPELLGKDLGGVGRLLDRGLFGSGGVANFVGDKVGWAAGSIYDLLTGGKEKTVPPSFAGPQQGYQQASYFAPQPPTPQPVVSSRPLQPANFDPKPLSPAAVNRIMTDAEKSLQNAYSHKQTYDPNTGRWTATPIEPQAPAPVSYTPPQPSGNSGTFGNGLYQPWYGNTDPYDATGNMLNRVSAYDFGAGRYEGSPGLPSIWGGNSTDWPMWGPLARFSSDPNGTD